MIEKKKKIINYSTFEIGYLLNLIYSNYFGNRLAKKKKLIVNLKSS